MSLPHSLLPRHHYTFILVGPWAQTNYPKDKKQHIIYTITWPQVGCRQYSNVYCKCTRPASRLNPMLPLLPSHAVHFLRHALYPLHFSGSTPEEAYLVRFWLRCDHCCAYLFWEPSENHWIWCVVSPLRVQGTCWLALTS